MLTVRQRVQASRVMGEVERPAPNDLELKSGLRCVFRTRCSDTRRSHDNCWALQVEL
jgi:hypothetical protein